ncbi:GH12270 [Drosophila grimshawi]|uniref:GH12270 n=2 Tax=Drosophila grimshawi TaxID=7222 RepID=B4JJE7_DROGR|nr:GH12270 [Drosophila grimshawi]
MGRNAAAAAATAPAAAAEHGNGRDLFKKFMLWRNLFPTEPARDNIIVVTQPTYTTLTPTGTPTTTTTTTTANNDANLRSWRNLEDEDAQNRISQRTSHRIRPNTKTRSYGQRRRPQLKKKKKTRHRHIHKRPQQHRYKHR